MDAFEKIKERLRNQFDTLDVDGDNDWNIATRQALSIVSEVEAEYGNGWIPCSERLPEVGRCVICHAKENDEDSGEMLYGWYCGESKFNPPWSLLRFDSEN